MTDHPRPQLRRDNWTSLDGLWQYAICDTASAKPPVSYDGDILVPFSPECKLSGVNRQLLPGQTLWYSRTIQFEAIPPGQRRLLHFGAVDQICEVFVDGVSVGTHSGGYWPFSFDITALSGAGEHTLTVRVTDDSDTGVEAYGKQKLKRGGIWYTAQSGIWQTVWTELVPEVYITSVKITPLYDDKEVSFTVTLSDGKENYFTLPVPNFHPWSPDDPYLYDVTLEAGSDKVYTYFGMRKFHTLTDKDGHPRLALNGKILFHSGLLDQGYWDGGLYTAPSDEAVIRELTEIKRLGFNMLRKHIKIEPMRWYYHCDRLGILVWQDMVSGGTPYNDWVTRYLPFVSFTLKDKHYHLFGRKEVESRNSFRRDLRRTVNLLYNVVSLAVWVPFNEGWGQFDAARITDELRLLDNTRHIDHTSGWHDQGAGDFKSWHIYYKPFSMKSDKTNRIQALTEFGGYSLALSGHLNSKKPCGYRFYKTPEALTEGIVKLYREEVLSAAANGLSAAVYTQVSDVEDECNGLFTYDRAVLKVNADAIREVNNKLLRTVL